MRSARQSKQTLSAHAAADQATPRSTWAQLQTCSKQKQCSHNASQANLYWNVPEIRPMSCQTQLHMLGNFKQLCEAFQEQGGGQAPASPSALDLTSFLNKTRDLLRTAALHPSRRKQQRLSHVREVHSSNARRSPCAFLADSQGGAHCCPAALLQRKTAVR